MTAAGVRVAIDRWGYTEFGTLGRLTVFWHETIPTFTCLTAENPHRENRPNLSCVPEGEYELRRSFFHGGGYPTFEIFLRGGGPIPGRSLVKIHVGNTADDVEGCVVLGRRPIELRGKWGVGPSGGPSGAFTGFMREMDRLEVERCPLSIRLVKG